MLCKLVNYIALVFQKYLSSHFLLVASITIFSSLYADEGSWPKVSAEILAMNFPPTDEKTHREIDEICLAWFDQVKANEYQAAIEILYRGLQKYPYSFSLQTRLAAILGDYAEHCDTERKQMLQQSKQLFEKLSKEVCAQPKREQFYFNNEYNYRFAFYKEQYENGLAMVEYYFDLPDMASYGYKGYYGQGVGAANYAKQLLLERNEPIAKKYAKKAVIAWAQYLSYCNSYYNAYVHYGLALGILGETQEMIRALQRGAQLIHSDLNYYEFKEVIEFIANLRDFRPT